MGENICLDFFIYFSCTWLNTLGEFPRMENYFAYLGENLGDYLGENLGDYLEKFETNEVLTVCGLTYFF